jgi:putative membrane protein
MKRLSLAAALAVLGAAWLGPLPALARTAFWAHMTLHMAVVAIAAPLLALCLAGTRADPARRASLLAAPIPASIAELLVVWLWHAPLLHHAARSASGVFALEQASFLAVGVLLWSSAVGGDPVRQRWRSAAGVAALFFTAVHMTLLGAIFALTPRPLYAHTAPGEDALFDQHLGGGIMLLVGGASYLAGGLWLTRRMLTAKSSSRGGEPMHLGPL